MKRMSLILSLLAVILLSASLAYWGLQLFQPKPRPQVAAAQPAMPEPAIDAAAGLFGGQAVTAVSSFQLKGVVAAVRARDGVAIIAADGKPAQAYKVGQDISPGVTVKEVAPRFVMLSEGGVAKRIDLPADGNTSLSQGGSGNSGNGGNSGAMPPIVPPPPPSQQPMPPPPPPAMNAAPTIVTPPTQ